MKIELTILNTEPTFGPKYPLKTIGFETEYIDHDIIDWTNKTQGITKVVLRDIEISDNYSLDCLKRFLERVRTANAFGPNDSPGGEEISSMVGEVGLQSETIKPALVRYLLNKAFGELKFGRTAEDQKFLDECIEKLQKS